MKLYKTFVCGTQRKMFKKCAVDRPRLSSFIKHTNPSIIKVLHTTCALLSITCGDNIWIFSISTFFFFASATCNFHLTLWHKRFCWIKHFQILEKNQLLKITINHVNHITWFNNSCPSGWQRLHFLVLSSKHKQLRETTDFYRWNMKLEKLEFYAKVHLFQ